MRRGMPPIRWGLKPVLLLTLLSACVAVLQNEMMESLIAVTTDNFNGVFWALASVTWLPDGKTLASGSLDGPIVIWDAWTGQLLRTLTGHGDVVYSVSWSPDGKTLASGSRDNTIKLWDVSTWQLLRTLTGHDSSVISVSWSPDGKTLASGSSDNTIKLWDVSTWQLVRTLTGHDSSVISVSWSPDGKTLASGSLDYTIKLWDVSTWQLVRTLAGHGGDLTSVSWSPDGKTLASGSRDNTIKLWDASTWQLIRTLTGHDHYVNSVSWSPDGKTLASGSDDSTIKLWDASTWQLLRTLTHGRWATSFVSWSPDGKTLASTSDVDWNIKLWDASIGQLLSTLKGHHNWVASVTWLPDGKTLASGSGDGPIVIWDAWTGQLLRTLTGHGDVVYSVSWSPDGKTLASGSRDNTIKLWDASTWQLLRTLTGHDSSVISVSWSPDGKTLASGSYDYTIKLWDASTWQLVRTLTGHDSDGKHHGVASVSWSPDGKTLASGLEDNTIKLWDVSTWQLVRTLTGHDSSVRSVSWSPDGKTLASGGSYDYTIKLWDASSWQLLSTLSGRDSYVNSVSWSPDGKTLASGVGDGGLDGSTIMLWDASTWQLLRTLTGHDDSVTSVSWSPDGKTLASGSGDNTIKLWSPSFSHLISSTVYTFGSQIQVGGRGLQSDDWLLVFGSSTNFRCPNYGPGIVNEVAFRTLRLSVNSSYTAVAELDSIQDPGAYFLCYYSSKRFYNPVGGYAALNLGAVAVRDRPAEALSVSSADGRCRLTSSAPVSASRAGVAAADGLLVCPPGADNVTARVVGRFAFSMRGRRRADFLVERVRFGQWSCAVVSADVLLDEEEEPGGGGRTGLTAAEKAAWTDWNSTGIAAFRCTLPRGYGDRLPVHIDLRQGQQGLRPQYLLSYASCPLFSFPNEEMRKGADGGACLCERGYFAAEAGEAGEAWEWLRAEGLLLPVQLDTNDNDDMFSFRCSQCPNGAECGGEAEGKLVGEPGLVEADLYASPGFFHMNRSQVGNQLFLFEPCLTGDAAGCNMVGAGLYYQPVEGPVDPAAAAARCASDLYTGILCSKCADGNYRTNDFECFPCQQSAWTTMGGYSALAACGAALLWLLVALLSRGLFEQNKDSSASDRSVLIKISLNGYLTASLVLRTSLPWPGWVSAAAATLQGLAGDGAGRLLDLDCVLGSQTAVYAKKAALLALPILMLACAWLACLCATRLRCCCRPFKCAPRGQRLSVKQQTRGSMVILLTFTYTTFCESSLSLFSCHQLETAQKSLFLFDTDLTCWEGSHMVYLLALALPGLALYVIGMPAFAVAQIRRHRRGPAGSSAVRVAADGIGLDVLRNSASSVDSSEGGPAGEEDGWWQDASSVSSFSSSSGALPPSASDIFAATPESRSYAYLTRGYASGAYLWETAVLARKVLLAVVVVLWRERGQVQLVLMSLLVLVATAAQAHYRPFASPRANRLELLSLLLAGALAALGQLLYLAEGRAATEEQRTALATCCALVLVAHVAFTLTTVLPCCQRKGTADKQAKSPKPPKSLKSPKRLARFFGSRSSRSRGGGPSSRLQSAKQSMLTHQHAPAAAGGVS